MYIHVGDGVSIRRRDVIGIFDIDGETTTAATADFLKKCEKKGITESAGDMLPRSVVLCEDFRGRRGRRGRRFRDGRLRGSLRGERRYRVIFSHLSSGTLGMR